MNNLSIETLDFIKLNKFNEQEVTEAIQDAEFCGVFVIQALEMNRDFRDNTEYFETNYPDFY